MQGLSNISEHTVQVSANDFYRFFKSDQTIFQNRTSGFWVYGKYVSQK